MESSESSEDEGDAKPSTPIAGKNVKHDLMMKMEVPFIYSIVSSMPG